MTRRFDRDPRKGKIHFQSFCAIQHYDFNDIQMHSHEQLFETMRILGLPYPQAEQLFRRMVFNVIARNCDDHTKNFAFVMSKENEWRLSSAYDVCHSYRPESTWVSQQSLSVNGKRKDIGYDDLIGVARQMNIKRAAGIIAEINGIVQDWQKYAAITDTRPELIKAIGKTLLNIRKQ